MRLESLVLHNVGVYSGRQKIDLSTTSDQPVVLIGGLNGCGKTTLLDSIQLCLYGQRARCAGRGTRTYDDYLRGLISRRTRHSDGASIELTFAVRHEGVDHRYRVVRAWSESGKSIREFVSVFIDDKISPSASDGWADWVEDLLPLELSGLFLFDGEKVKDLADPSSAAAVIKTAINSLLGAGAIERLRTDLLVLRRRQSPPDEDTALTERIASLVGQLKELEHERDALVQRRAAIADELRIAETALTEADDAFAAGGGELHMRRSEMEAGRRTTAAAIDRNARALAEVAEGALPMALLSGVSSRLDDLATAGARADEAAILLAAVEDRDTWVLSLVSEDAAGRLAGVLAEDRQRIESAAASDGPRFEAGTVGRLSIARAGMAHDAKVAESLVAERNQLRVELAEFDLKLARVPAEDAVQRLASAVDAARANVAKVQGKLELTDQDLEFAALRTQELETELAQAEAQRRELLAEGDYVRRVLEHIERVRDTLAELRSRQIATHIQQVEVAALDSFGRLMRKKGLVADLSIDPQTFQITLRNADGNEIPTSSLSAGESQILAISLLWGLARVADRPMATVVDTPLGRLDSINRQLLVDRYFPNAGDQVLLLSTDEEIDRDLFARLSPRIARSYLLNHNDQTHTTTVDNGYWWSQEAS